MRPYCTFFKISVPRCGVTHAKIIKYACNNHRQLLSKSRQDSTKMNEFIRWKMKGVREHCGGDRKGISIFREYGYVGRNGNSQKIKMTMGFFLGQSLN